MMTASMEEDLKMAAYMEKHNIHCGDAEPPPPPPPPPPPKPDKPEGDEDEDTQ